MCITAVFFGHRILQSEHTSETSFIISAHRLTKITLLTLIATLYSRPRFKDARLKSTPRYKDDIFYRTMVARR